MNKRYQIMLAIAALASGTAMAQSYRPWMSSEVADAWAKGYKGQRVTITVVDNFSNKTRFWGRLGFFPWYQGHGQWTSTEAGMIAPNAELLLFDYTTTSTRVSLAPGLNVINASYSMMASAGTSPSAITWTPREASIIDYAKSGAAVISKAAGNEDRAIDVATAGGKKDFLALALVDAPSALFVGALNRNGTPTAKASLAEDSNTPGTNVTIQNQYIMVGVDSGSTWLHGTSFAAPIIAGYAAILGSKFTTANPTAITRQLLTTARQDTIQNYNPATHGRGEASLTRALAPISIR